MKIRKSSTIDFDKSDIPLIVQHPESDGRPAVAELLMISKNEMLGMRFTTAQLPQLKNLVGILEAIAVGESLGEKGEKKNDDDIPF